MHLRDPYHEWATICHLDSSATPSGNTLTPTLTPPAANTSTQFPPLSPPTLQTHPQWPQSLRLAHLPVTPGSSGLPRIGSDPPLPNSPTGFRVIPHAQKPSFLCPAPSTTKPFNPNPYLHPPQNPPSGPNDVILPIGGPPRYFWQRWAAKKEQQAAAAAGNAAAKAQGLSLAGRTVGECADVFDRWAWGSGIWTF